MDCIFLRYSRVFDKVEENLGITGIRVHKCHRICHKIKNVGINNAKKSSKTYRN